MDGAGSVESRLQGDFLKFRQSLGKGEIEGAMLESVSILERSRSKEERAPVIEALVRMAVSYTHLTLPTICSV